MKEYIALMKNPTSYHKLTDETWDFDVFMDMCFSFWTLAPITSSHKHVRTAISNPHSHKSVRHSCCRHALDAPTQAAPTQARRSS